MIGNKKALWLACNSNYGDRLIEITKEHISLAKELCLNGRLITDGDRKRAIARIEALRLERDGIISQFEKNPHIC